MSLLLLAFDILNHSHDTCNAPLIFLQIKNINKPNVYMRDSVRVREKLKILYQGGAEKLQVCEVT